MARLKAGAARLVRTGQEERFVFVLIAQLAGNVARTLGGAVVVDVNGVGYKVNVPASVLESLPAPGQPLTLLTHTLVREDDISLFGFLGEQELRVFQLLLTVSGIGPKVALALLSALPAEDLARAAASEDVRTLTRVPGVGAKTAQRLVLELKDKLAALTLEFAGLFGPDKTPAAVSDKDPAQALVDDVIAALLNLGYNKPEAARATEAAVEERAKADLPPPDFGRLLRATLNRLTKGR